MHSELAAHFPYLVKDFDSKQKEVAAMECLEADRRSGSSQTAISGIR